MKKNDGANGMKIQVINSDGEKEPFRPRKISQKGQYYLRKK